ncbi:MAG: anti-sigma factor [Pseudomonadota bacterium]
MTTDTKELAKLHELMCADALEGGLSLDDSVVCQRLSERYPQVNTHFYWEALGAADLVLDGSGSEPPPEVREGWIALSESVGLKVTGEDSLDSTVAVWDEHAVDVERYAAERSLGQGESQEGRSWPWILLLVVALAGAGYWLYPDVSRALERNETFRQWLGLPQPQGESQPVLLALTGEEAGRVVWDAVLQRGRLEVNTRGMTVAPARQAQVWVVDADRGQQHVPAALLDLSRALQTVELATPVQIRRYAGILITSEPIGGSLTPSRTHVLASHNPIADP